MRQYAPTCQPARHSQVLDKTEAAINWQAAGSPQLPGMRLQAAATAEGRRLRLWALGMCLELLLGGSRWRGGLMKSWVGAGILMALCRPGKFELA